MKTAWTDFPSEASDGVEQGALVCCPAGQQIECGLVWGECAWRSVGLCNDFHISSHPLNLDRLLIDFWDSVTCVFSFSSCFHHDSSLLALFAPPSPLHLFFSLFSFTPASSCLSFLPFVFISIPSLFSLSVLHTHNIKDTWLWHPL